MASSASGVSDEEEQKNLMVQSRTGAPAAATGIPASAVFLVCALGLFAASNVAMIPIAAAKADGAQFTWGVGFLPLWVADALILVLHLAAIVSSICSLGALDVKDRIQYNKDAPHLTGPVKNILYFLLVHPFFGLLPTLPMLGFLFGFHLDLWAFLATLDNGGNPPQLWRTFACIYTLCVIAFLCYMCCLKRFMATLRMVCLYTALMLIPLKYQGQVSMTWLSTLAPLVAMLLLLVVQLSYILANDMFCGRRGSMHLKDNVQRACAVGFICGACACVAGICLLARLLDNPDSPVALEDNAYQRTMLPLTIGAAVATVSLIVNASCRGSELTRFMFMHDAPGAAADDARSGAYEVSGLGLVELRTGVDGEPKSAYTHAFDCVCGGAY